MWGFYNSEDANCDRLELLLHVVWYVGTNFSDILPPVHNTNVYNPLGKCNFLQVRVAKLLLIMNSIVFCVVTMCSSERTQRFRGTYRLAQLVAIFRSFIA
jgi:hypothetical protein